MYNIIHGDCLDYLPKIKEGSVDLILIDPPYGNMKGAAVPGWKNKNEKLMWDIKLNTDTMFMNISRLLKHNGRAIIFSKEPYTNELYNAFKYSLIYNQRAVYIKDNIGNPLMCKKALCSRFEDILIFTKYYDYEKTNEQREYHQKIFEYINKTVKDITKDIGTTTHTHYWTNGLQFSYISKKDYEFFINNYNINKMNGFFEYDEYINKKNNKPFPTYNAKQLKTDIFEYKKPTEHFHPTQKPVALLEDLIKTYSNEEDTVLDFTMGSGSTGVACIRTNRNFIGIEKDQKYFDIAKKRIEEEEEKC